MSTKLGELQYHDKLRAKLRLMFNAPDMQTARHLFAEIAFAYTEKAPRSISCLEAGFEDAMAVIVLPEQYRRRLRSTNGLERLNSEVRRSERMIGIFPNTDSALRLLGAMLMEQDEEWTTGRCYFRMENYWEWKQSLSQEQADEPTSERDLAA